MNEGTGSNDGLQSRPFEGTELRKTIDEAFNQRQSEPEVPLVESTPNASDPLEVGNQEYPPYDDRNARKQSNTRLENWGKLIGSEAKDALRAVKVRDWKDFLALSAATVSDVTPGLKWVPLVMASVNTAVMLGAESRSVWKANKDAKRYNSSLIEEYDGLLKPILELFGAESKDFNDKLSIRHRALAVSLGILASTGGLYASEIAGKFVGVPVASRLVNRFVFRGITQYILPRVVAELAGTLFARKSGQEDNDHFVQLTKEAITATTVILTTATLFGKGTEETGSESPDFEELTASPTDAEVAAAEVTATQVPSSIIPSREPGEVDVTPTPEPTPTVEPTPEFVNLMPPYGEVPTQAILDQAEALGDSHFVEHQGVSYYFLDDQIGPDVLVAGEYTYVSFGDGTFGLDLDGDGFVDAGYSWSADSLVPEELQNDNQNSIDPTGFESGPAKMAKLAQSELLIELQPPTEMDTDGDGTMDIFKHTDGNYYLDTNNNGEIDSEQDVQLLEPPVVRVSEGQLVIDKMELVNGQAWFRDAGGHIVGVVQDESGNWFIDRGSNDTEVKIGTEFIAGEEDVALAGLPEGINIVTVNEDLGQYRLEVSRIDFADGSNWQFDRDIDGKITNIEGQQSNGSNLALAAEAKGVMRYQYFMALGNPLVSPDIIGQQAATAYANDPTLTNDQLAGYVVANVTANNSNDSQPTGDFWTRDVDGNLVGVLTIDDNGHTTALATDGSWNAIVQAEIIKQVDSKITDINPNTLGGIATRSFAATGIISGMPAGATFSDLTTQQQQTIYQHYNTEVGTLSLIREFQNLNQVNEYGLSNDQIRDLVAEFMKSQNITNNKFVSSHLGWNFLSLLGIDQAEFEAWLIKNKKIP